MITTPQITQTAACQTAVIHLTVPIDDMSQAMGPAFEELYGTVFGQGLTITGPPYSYYLPMQPGIFDFELGVPVSSPVSPTGRVRPGTLPAATVARTTYQGSYDGLGQAWSELDQWITANGHTPSGNCWEVYVAGPDTSPDPANWVTELDRPLQ